MTDQDFPAFMEVLRTVVAVFHIREDVDVLSTAYFTALRQFPLGLVAQAAEVCTATLKRFPKPVEWAERVPRGTTVAAVPTMSPSEASAHLEAEGWHYEMPPCLCWDCEAAGIHRPLRYVPDDDDPRARLGTRIVTRGHWAHGYELVRWYAAREAFWTAARALGHPSTLLTPTGHRARQRMAKAGLVAMTPAASREPGEDD